MEKQKLYALLSQAVPVLCLQKQIFIRLQKKSFSAFCWSVNVLLWNMSLGVKNIKELALFHKLTLSSLSNVNILITLQFKWTDIIYQNFLVFTALLSETLRTYTRTGCDHEPITLSCPRGTSISIDVAQYMPTSMENECVAVTENIIQDGVVNAGTEIEIKAPEKCSWPNVMSVSIF